MKYHFDTKTGWLGGPCGITFYKGMYHVFYQIYPYAPHYGPMHWGHLISKDLIGFEDLGICLTPEDEANGMGCESGSCMVRGDELHLFYASGDTGIYAASSSDGKTFTKKGLLLPAPSGYKFRTPFVFEYEGSYRMLVGAGHGNIAKILMYSSEDLSSWTGGSELLSDARFGSVIEYPQLIRDKDKWILILQSEKHLPSKVLFASGTFDGEAFVFDTEDVQGRFCEIESGPEFLAPVSFGNILMGWLFSTKHGGASCISAPRRVFIGKDGEPAMELIEDLKGRLISGSMFVRYENGRLEVVFDNRTLWSKAYAREPSCMVLEDVGTVEIFMEGGAENVSMFIC
ncbi:MAG: glycoside hydrolase family 32 protein [Saccharofermentans sp.]|nr:glycoside hydrolase family 32 protein [Saccharofermentans sp.]